MWHPELLAELIASIEPVSVRTLQCWLKDGFPESPPGDTRTVLIGGLQTVVETMMQTQSPDAVSDWLRTHILAVVRVWKSHWPDVGLVFVMDGPGTLFEFNEADDLVYFGRGRDRAKKVKLSQAIWNGAASGTGSYQLVTDKPTGKEIGGYHVVWMS